MSRGTALFLSAVVARHCRMSRGSVKEHSADVRRQDILTYHIIQHSSYQYLLCHQYFLPYSVCETDFEDEFIVVYCNRESENY